jgi:glycosyltransferase involved in cell wall biosynthesis
LTFEPLPDQASVAVVIPCRNEQAHIDALLDALADQTRTPNEVIIVDDQSTDDTRKRIDQWCVQHPDHATSVRVVSGPGCGPGPAMNTGIRATSADLIIRLDGHCVPERHYIEYCCEALRRADVGVVGGVWRIVAGASTPMARAIAAVVSHPVGSGGAAYRHAEGPGPRQQSVDTVPFGAFRRDLWEKLGGYDESLEANQDYDFNYRSRAHGLSVLLDRRIVAMYSARATLRTLWRQYERYGYWKVVMLAKDPRALALRQVPPAVLLPWLMLSLAMAVGVMSDLSSASPWQTSVALGSALAYPVVVMGVGIQIGFARSVSPLAAAAAIAVIHIAWSTGVWRRVLRVAK